MTVTSRKTSEGVRWRYDFRHDGERYASKAIYTSKREAIAEEKARKKALERGDAEPVEAAPAPAPKRKGGAITLQAARDAYWIDVAQHHRSAKDIERRLAHCIRLIGADADVLAIKYATVNEAIRTRRGELNARGQPLSNAGVNRDVIDQLRPVLKHAAELHELSLPFINWKKLRLKEAGDLVCEFTDAEIAAWLAALRDPAEQLYLATALTYGPRRGELFFAPDSLKIDAPGGPELEFGRYLNREGIWRESRKDGSLHTVQLDPLDAEALAAQRARAIDAGAPHIWIDQAGALISYYAMGWRIRQGAKRAGIVKTRIVHGMRHHAATAIMRANEGSLVLAQHLLGHKQITTTSRYAHVAKSDARKAQQKRGRIAIPEAAPVLETAPTAAQIAARSHARVTPGAKPRAM